MNFISSKKGQAENYFAVVVFLFIFGFMSFLGFLFISEMTDAFYSAGYNDGQIKATGEDFVNSVKLFDYIIVFIMAVLVIGVGFTSFRLAATPIGYIVTIIMAAFWGLVSYFFNFIFIQMVSDPVFTTTILFFPRTILICTNLHWIMLANIIIGSITLYAKKPKGQFIE